LHRFREKHPCLDFIGRVFSPSDKRKIFCNQKRYQVNTLSYRTVHANKETVERNWYIIDAEGEVAGRLFSRVAAVLRGKHKPSYTPHVDTGDNVIIINAEKVRFTGKKLDQKEYQTYSGYQGGQKRIVARDLIARKPVYLVERGIKGMLPKNRLGRAMAKKMFVYEGAEHPHQAQQPKEFKF
jgi:large subunit ribosomal protein L13